MRCVKQIGMHSRGLLAISLIAFTAYVWLLRNTSAAYVATYAYVNPVVAVLLGWAFLEWRFDSSAFAFVTSDLGLFQFEVSPMADLWAAAGEVARNIAFVPVYVAVALLLILRRPINGLGFLIPVAGLILVRWSGLFYSATATLVLLTLLAMVSVPSKPTRLGRWIVPAAATAQLLMNVAMPPETPGFDGWLTLLG